MAHILAIDDDQDVLDSITEILAQSNVTVTCATNGQDGLDLLRDQCIDLVVLDIVMPDIDGIEVCRRIRADPALARIPILFLTAKSRSGDIARGLDAGGDDYLVKPYDVIELPARVRALLRRAPGGVLDSGSDCVQFGAVTLYFDRREIDVDGHSVPLTPTEHRLLHALMMRGGQPVSTETLLEEVWEYPPGVGDPQLVRVHANNLRAKLLAADCDCIQTQHGKGYLITR